MELGLTEKEAQVYIALLELEKAPVQDIARRSKVNRSTCYVSLESLHEQGFVDISADRAVREYLPSSPEAILTHAREMAEKQSKVLSGIEKIIPELSALKKGIKEKPKILVYEGREAVKRSLFDVLEGNKGQRLRVYENKNNLDYLELYPGIAEEDSLIRHQNKNQMLLICPDNKMNRECKEIFRKDPNNIDEIILLKETEIPQQHKQSSDFSICGNKVIFYSIDDKFAILIENKNIADSLKGIFDFTWKKVGGKMIKNKK